MSQPQTNCLDLWTTVVVVKNKQKTTWLHTLTNSTSKACSVDSTFHAHIFSQRNMTAEHISQIFWSEVQALHDAGFQVLAACADGASYNRTFFKMNCSEEPWKAFNPWSRETIFFLSDPPHLFKKLRNQIFNSGSLPQHTRHMVLAGKGIIWSHVEDVFNRGILRATPSTRENIYLDSL